MFVVPPVLPEKTLQRVLAIARVDGWSIVIVAALSGLVTLLQGGWFGAATALLIVLAGAGELRGRHLLLRREMSGVNWLVGAQLFLLVVIWIYAWYRWRYFDPAAIWSELPAFVRTELDRQMLVAGLDPALDRPPLLRMMNVLVCAILAFVTLIYQGGLALYYLRQRDRIRQALSAGNRR
jgi:hypothetical protein